MPRTATSATSDAARPSTAPAYLLAYLEAKEVRVYAPRKQCLWAVQQLPQQEERRIEAELQRLQRSGERTSVLEIEFSADGEAGSTRVVCVRG